MMNDRELMESYLNADDECRALVWEVLTSEKPLEELQPRIDAYIQSRKENKA
ncbi:MAG: hypothetical protein K6E16_09860 [Lachnospiraceae bacterium]|nr:hypothetical protein [Lachnospiraceae bacterium]